MVKTDLEKLQELCAMTYKQQLVWFLNAYWHTVGERDAELFWRFHAKLVELDLQNKDNGTALDEMNAHVFLEFFKETMTVRAMREKLRETAAIGPSERPKNVPITHILLFKYSVSWKELVNASQGDNKAEIEEAQRRLEAVQAAFRQAEAAAKAAAQAARAAEASAQEARVREAEAEAAANELKAALAEVEAQEHARNRKTEELTRKTQEGGVVSRGKAQSELAQHLAEDPLPLRKAKITAEAAVKRAEKTKQAAADARAAAERDHQLALEKQAAADAALADAERQVAEAEDYLNEVKRKPGQAQGAIWWIERELREAKAYMPESKGGYRKAK